MGYICFSFFELLQRRKKDWDAQLEKLPEGRRKPWFNDSARLALIVDGGCLKTSYGAGFLKSLDDHFGVELQGIKSVLHLVDEVVLISGGAPVALASVSGKLDKAPDIYKILTSSQFFSAYRLAKLEIMPQRAARAGQRPPIDMDFALGAMEQLGMNFNAFNELGINATYLTTRHETGEQVAIRNPDGEISKLAARASMTIPYLAGEPVTINDMRLHDGGFSDDPTGYNYAVNGLNASHVLYASNNHVAHINPNGGHGDHLMRSALQVHPGALEAYVLCHERQREIHNDATNVFESSIHNRGLISNKKGVTVCLETTFPEEHSVFDHLETDARLLMKRINEGYENGQLLAAHYLEGQPLPEVHMRPMLITSSDAPDLMTIMATASATAVGNGAVAMSNMTVVLIRAGGSLALASIRSLPIPFWQTARAPSAHSDSSPV